MRGSTLRWRNRGRWRRLEHGLTGSPLFDRRAFNRGGVDALASRRRPREDLDWCDESVAALRQGLDESGTFGRIPERLAQAVHRRVQAVVEIDERVSRPELLAEFVASNEIAAAVHEEQKDVEWAAAQLDDAALLAQFAQAAVDFEQAEAIDTFERDARLHAGGEPRF